MKKIIVAVLVAIGAIGLGACSSSEERTTKPDHSYVEPAEPEPVSSSSAAERVYLATLADEGITHPKGDDHLVSMGYVICQFLDEEPNPTAMTLIGMGMATADELGSTNSDGGYVVGAAIGSFCTEYLYLIP
ncbi:DUF732 domain-containing protein [Nocardia sp. NPDC003979]